MSSIFGVITANAVTIDTDQSVSGKKRFLNVDNEFDGTMNQPTILALSQTIDPTELSFLAGVSSNIQTQFAGINIVLTGLTALEQALQAIEPAPNATTVQFNNTIVLVDSVGVDIATLTNEHVEIVAAIDQIAAIGFNPTTTTDPKVYLQNGVNTMTMSATIVNLTTPTNMAELSSDSLICTNLSAPLPGNFKFQADTNFFKFECGSSYRIRGDDGQRVNKDDAIIVTTSSISNYDFRRYDKYLDSNGLGGFSVIIIHPGSVPDPTINTPDLVFVGTQIGVTTNFILPKWTIARFILTPTDPSIGYPHDFVWMVSW